MKFSSIIISVKSYSAYVDFSKDAISSRSLEFGDKSKHVRYITNQVDLLTQKCTQRIYSGRIGFLGTFIGIRERIRNAGNKGMPFKSRSREMSSD